MAYIQQIAPQEASGALREIYDAELANGGYIPNHVAAFGLRPEVLTAWRGLLQSIRAHMRLRRYELVTFAAAKAMGCVY